MKESECYPGKKIGRLTLIERHREHFDNYGNRWVWHCKCECGNTIDRPTFQLGTYKTRTGMLDCGHHTREKLVASGKRVSQAWAKTDEEVSDSNRRSKWRRLYVKFGDMHRRCESPQCNNYPNYGARGISVCNEWFDYDTFKQWAVSNGYDPNNTNRNEQSIDRIDVNGNYEPGNCRLTNISVQNNNRRDNQKVTIGNETHTVVEWGRLKGIPTPTIGARWQNRDRGENLIRPVDTRHSWTNPIKVLVFDESLTVSQAAEKLQVSKTSIRNWIRAGRLHLAEDNCPYPVNQTA